MKAKAKHADEADTDRTERDYLDALISEQEAAAFLGLSVRFLQNRRTRGGGPTFVGISRRCVRYRRRELIAWSDGLSRAHTSQTVTTAADPVKAAEPDRADAPLRQLTAKG